MAFTLFDVISENFINFFTALLIENHKGIKLYTEKEIIVKCKKFNIEISGSELFIREITDEYIYIYGIVENIKYSMWE